jgi:hypothetical protein
VAFTGWPGQSWSSDGVNFDPAHLWFLSVLLVFSLVLLPLFRYLAGPRGAGLAARAAAVAGRHPLAPWPRPPCR